MSGLTPAGQAERAAQLFAELRAAKDELERRRIPEVIAEIHRDRLWLALNYASWGEACDALMGGVRLQFPREDRREIVAELRDEGLSTRAIGTAIGVSEATVRRDLPTASNDAVDEPVTVKSLDGKDRTYTPKPATVIHIDPDEVPDDEVAEVTAMLNEYADSGSDVQAAKERARFSKWLYAIHQRHLFDAEYFAAIYPERADDVQASLNGLSEWATAYLNHINESHTLRVIHGESK